MKRPYEAFDRRAVSRLVTGLVVLAVAMPATMGAVGAQEIQQEETFAVVQGEECVPIEPITGEESAKTFYDYRIPALESDEIDPENPYYNASGWSYSSEGTADLQRANESTLFLYEDDEGTLSLVFVHGSVEGPSEGGSLSVTVADLPEDGEWVVKDDEYENGHNYDLWTHGGEYDRIDWTWADNRTDGGVYEGLGEDFTITVYSAFNENATLHERYYTGTVEAWTVLSGDRTSPQEVELTPEEPVVVSDADCADLEGVTDDLEDVTAGTVDGEATAPGVDAAAEERILEYRAADNAGPIDVTFTVEGTVDYGDEAEPSSDFIEENDGTVTVTSPNLNPNAVDSWVVTGRIVDFAVSGGELETLRIDGEEVSIEELPETDGSDG